jgi:hypothetical protein
VGGGDGRGGGGRGGSESGTSRCARSVAWNRHLQRVRSSHTLRSVESRGRRRGAVSVALSQHEATRKSFYAEGFAIPTWVFWHVKGAGARGGLSESNQSALGCIAVFMNPNLIVHRFSS